MLSSQGETGPRQALCPRNRPQCCPPTRPPRLGTHTHTQMARPTQRLRPGECFPRSSVNSHTPDISTVLGPGPVHSRLSSGPPERVFPEQTASWHSAGHGPLPYPRPGGPRQGFREG